MPALRCGADRLGEYKHLFKDARVGLVTTPTGRTSDGRSTIAALQQAADLRVLLGPEHGVRGDGAAGAFIPQYTDAATGLPVFSLYGKDSKRLTPAMLETFDVLVYDIQDVGSRYYTFLSTLAYLIEEYAGALPTWMMPEQVRFLPITDRAADYCAQQAAELRKQGFRVEVDSRNEKVGKKIREATLEKIPYMLVVGDRDMEAGTVSVRTRTGEDLGAMSLTDFSALLRDVVDSKARK